MYTVIEGGNSMRWKNKIPVVQVYLPVVVVMFNNIRVRESISIFNRETLFVVN